MIIAIVGGDATGKTTLARALSGSLAIPVLEPVKDRLLGESGYHTIFEWDAATRGLDGLIEAQVEREASFGAGIVDGGAVELFCMVQRWAWHRLSPARSERLYDQVVAAARRYRTVIVVPSPLVAGPAPGRFRSEEHNLQLARLIEAFLREASIPHCCITGAAADERFDEALRACGAS